MCGIIAVQRVKITGDEFERGMHEIQSRGRDHSHVIACDENIFFGFSLLGISSKDPYKLTQPFQDAEKILTVAVNGEIFNYKELRKRLVTAGCVFTTDSDGEVVLHGLKLYGVKFLSELLGDFAIVVYDRAKKSWLCAVDAVGSKPLKYFLTHNQFIVASHSRALKALGAEIKLSSQSVLFNLYNACLPMGKSLFENIHTIPPGHYLEVDENFCHSINPYTPYNSKTHLTDFDKLFRQCVIDRLPEHFTAAIALSSGIDSASVAIHLKQAGLNPHCFTVNFVDSEFSELADVKKFCTRHGFKLSVIDVRDVDLIEHFVAATINAENLAINPHGVGKMLLYRSIAGAGYRVTLTGDGADELLWGYDHFYATDEFQFVRQNNMIGAQHAQLLQPEWRADLFEKNIFRDYFRYSSNPSAQELYYKYWLNEYGLKVLGDSQASGESVEIRAPFLDSRLLSMFLNNTEMKARCFPSKKVLRDFLAPFDEKAAQIRKKPFTAPLINEHWLPLIDQYINSSTFAQLSIFNIEKVRDYFNRLRNPSPLATHLKPSSIVMTQILSLAIINEHLCI